MSDEVAGVIMGGCTRSECDDGLMRQNITSGDPFEAVYGYSRAVRIGDLVFVSGTTAQDPHVDGCDAYTQASNALGIVEQALGEAGVQLGDVVRTVTYVTDIADAPLVARAHSEVFADVLPAATIVEVSALDDPRRVVEIEVTAMSTD